VPFWVNVTSPPRGEPHGAVGGLEGAAIGHLAGDKKNVSLTRFDAAQVHHRSRGISGEYQGSVLEKVGIRRIQRGHYKTARINLCSPADGMEGRCLFLVA
jgi:hypothetical protein